MSVVKSLIVEPIRRSVRLARKQWSLHQLQSRWRNALVEVQAGSAHPPRTILFVPCDPRSLVGSRGDQAMISATLSALGTGAGARTFMVTGSDKASRLARQLGAEPLQLWSRPDFVGAIVEALGKVRPDAVFVLGADVIDGYYSLETSMRLLMAADLAARANVPSTVLGFSFNADAAPSMRAVLEAIHPDVRLNIRDEASLERFCAFTNASPRLVADVAFLLRPSGKGTSYSAAAEWAAERRSVGQRVFALNLHPTLFKRPTPESSKRLVSAAATAISAAYAGGGISWLLLPHDFRAAHGDNTILAPIADALGAKLGADLMHLPGEPDAAELKAIAGLMDGVVAGRMHLAIAALGMEVPAAGIAYQGKFHGLFRHFGLPEWLLLAPEDIEMEHRLENLILRFVAEAEALGAGVASRLPYVRDLAARNLEAIAP